MPRLRHDHEPTDGPPECVSDRYSVHTRPVAGSVREKRKRTLLQEIGPRLVHGQPQGETGDTARQWMVRRLRHVRRPVSAGNPALPSTDRGLAQRGDAVLGLHEVITSVMASRRDRYEDLS